MTADRQLADPEKAVLAFRASGHSLVLKDRFCGVEYLFRSALNQALCPRLKHGHVGIFVRYIATAGSFPNRPLSISISHRDRKQAITTPRNEQTEN
jgi:hypothetical protein